MTTPNTSGTNPLPNEIQSTQTQSTNYDASHIICNNDGTIDIKGTVSFDPPLPIIDTSTIFSPDNSSSLTCIDGATTLVIGKIDMQSNGIQNLSDPILQQDAVNLQYIQNNYTTTTNSEQFVNNAIGALDTVYMPIDTTLDAIPLAIADVDINLNKLINVLDPTDLQDAVNLEFLQNNYTDTINSQIYVDEEIALLSSVYMPIDQTLNNIPLATGSLDLNNNLISNVLDPISAQDAVTKNYLTTNYTNTTNSESFVNTAISGLSTVYMPIDQTLNNIPLATNNLNLNSNKITNLSNGVDQNDAVNVSQLSGYFPITTNLNGLSAQTGNYDSSGYQISVSSVPNIGNNLTNKTYVDGQINTRYANTTTLNNITIPNGSVNFNGVRATNLGNPNSAQDAVTLGYIQTFYATLTYIAANFYTQGYIIANYLTQSSAAATYATIASLASYVTNSALITTLADYTLLSTFNNTIATLVTSAYLVANYYTATYINSTFQTIANMSNYLTTSVAASTYQTIANMSNYVTNSSLASSLSAYYTGSYIDLTFATIASLSNYVTSSSLVTTLAGYVTSSYLTAQNYLKTSDIALYTTEIKTNSTVKSKVTCASAQEILFNVNDVQKLKMYVPSGQATSPCGLIADDKIQLVSNLNSMSFSGNAALLAKPAQNYTGLYIQGSDSSTLNVGAQLCVQPGQYSQNLTLSSGHTDVGGIQVPYSSLSNASGSIQNNLQISGGTPLTDQTLSLYSDSYATALGYNLTAQFSKKTGYSTTTTISEANQFTSKTYVDSAISGLSSVYLTIANASSTYLTQANASSIYQTIANMANYYTKTLSDARYYLNTVTLNNITAPNGNLSMNTSYKITNMLDCTSPQDAATKAYVDANIVSGGLTKAQADTYYMAIGTTLNNIPLAQGNVSINTQKITDLVAGTNNTDAVNLLQMTNAIAARTPFKSVQIVVGATNTSSSAVNVSSFTSTGSFVTSVTKQAQDPLLCAQQIVINYPNQTTIPTVFISVQQSGSAAPGAYGCIQNVYSTTTTQCSVCVRFPGSGGSPANSPSQFPSGVTLNCLFINPTPYPV